MLVELAQHAWERMRNPRDQEFPVSHNAYLHLFVQGDPILVRRGDGPA